MAASPQQAADAFLDWHRHSPVRGAPDAQALAQLEPLLTPALHCLLTVASGYRGAMARAYPQDKPPLAEGDLFSSLFEGPTRHQVLSVAVRRDSARVLVRFIHAPGAGQAPVVWRDALHLRRGAQGWRVADVEYLGQWDFAAKGRLRAGLVATLSVPDAAAPAVPQAARSCLRL